MNFLSYRPQSEIEFLSHQIQTFAVGARTSSGTMCTITPPDGQTFVLVSATTTVARAGISLGVGTISLRNDGVAIETLRGVAGGDFPGYPIIFKSKGNSLEGDGVKVFDFNLVISSANIVVHGTISGYLRNT